MIDIQEVITDSRVLRNRFFLRDDFVFTSITYPGNVYDAIVIKYPHDIQCASPRMAGSLRSLQEQIDFVNKHEIKKALIITDNIEFITLCPSLMHLWIVPGNGSGNNFDYSPLYRMSQIKSLQCTMACDTKDKISTCIDYSRIKGLESIHITNARQTNYNTVSTLKSLAISNYKKADLSDAFNGSVLDTLSIIQSQIKALEGIQKSEKMQCLYLYYNRSLQDIKALQKVKESLKALRIENCPKINDFSVLSELENLELLELTGSNVLPDLTFLKKMKSLKTFIFNMNVADGDLTPCLDLSYVYSERNRKHYNLKDADLPKGEYRRGNENIEEWRRLE